MEGKAVHAMNSWILQKKKKDFSGLEHFTSFMIYSLLLDILIEEWALLFVSPNGAQVFELGTNVTLNTVESWHW